MPDVQPVPRDAERVVERALVKTAEQAAVEVADDTLADSPRAVDPGVDVRAQSDRLLLSARKALAVGDMAQASRLVAQAKALPVKYEIHDDTPAKVEATIRKHAEVAQLSADKTSESYRRRYADLLMSQAEVLLSWKEFDDAERLATDASRVADHVWAVRSQAGRAVESCGRSAAPHRPFPRQCRCTGQLRLDRHRANGRRCRRAATSACSGSRGGGSNGAACGTSSLGRAERRDAAPARVQPSLPPSAVAKRAYYDAARDGTRNMTVAGSVPAGGRASSTEDVFRLPEQVDSPASRVSAETPVDADDHPPEPVPQAGETPIVERVPATSEPPAGALLKKSAEDRQILARKVIADLAAQRSEAKRVQASDPKKSLEILRQSRLMVEKSALDQETRERLLRSADRAIADAEQYIEMNRPRIELNERNQAVKDEIERERQVKVEVQEKLAYKVDEFNKLMDEHRWPEAEVIAKRAQELAPDEPVVQQLLAQIEFVRRLHNSKQIEADKEQGFVDQLNSVEIASIPYNDQNPIQWGDVKDWKKLSESPSVARSKVGHAAAKRKSRLKRA